MELEKPQGMLKLLLSGILKYRGDLNIFIIFGFIRKKR
jgi:hypothetical protein